VLQASPDHPCYAPAACTAPLGLTRWGRVHGESGVLRTPPERHTWTTMLSVFSIQRKIRDGRLPHDGITKVWSSPSAGETCDACDTILAKDQLVMEGETPRLAIAGSSSSTPPTLPAASGVALYAEPEEHGEPAGHHEPHQHTP